MNSRRYPACLEAGSSDLDAAAWLFLAERARKAYHQEKLVRQALERNGGHLIGFWDRGPCECFLVRFTTFAVLSFRGTERGEGLGDMIANLQAWRRPAWGIASEMSGPRPSVHAGFADSLDRVWADVEKELWALDGDRAPVYVCGHSKGGAEAIIAAWRWPLFRAVLTIGAPRVGNAAFARAFAERCPVHYRMVNGCDPVPRLPFLGLGARHDCRALLLDGPPHDGVIRHPHPAVEALVALGDWRPGRGLGRHEAADYSGRIGWAAHQAWEKARGKA